MPKLTNYATERQGISEWDFLNHELHLRNEKITSIRNSIAKSKLVIRGQKIDPPTYPQIYNFYAGITSANPSEGLIEHLYQYLFKLDRVSFWQNAEKTKNYNEWNDQKKALPQYPNPVAADTDDAFEKLENDKQALEKQLQEHILWYKPPPIEEEVKLKDLLPFVNVEDSAFRKKMKLLVLSLMKGYDNFKTETAVKWHENLKWYKEDEDESRQGVLYYKSKDGYDFGIAKVTFTGFDKEGKDIEIIAHQLFSDFTNTILGFKAEKIDTDFLNSLLDIDSQFCTAIIIYVGFVEKDITLMARYPAFSEDIKSLGNLFILNSRPWWRNAKDVKRRKAFSWTDCIENQSFSIGISKPYQTIRADAPNERCLWIEVPIEDSAAMIIGIDLLKNDDS